MVNRRKNRRKRPNQQRRYNPHTKRIEPFHGKKKSTKAPKPKVEGETSQGNNGVGFVPIKPTQMRKTVPCTCDGDLLKNTNQRMLRCLRDKRTRGCNTASNAFDVLVINGAFRREHRRHMGHFRAFLREEQIHFVEV